MNYGRREFLQFMGRSTVGLAGLSLASGVLSACTGPQLAPGVKLPFKPLRPSDKDDLVLAEGLSYHRFLSWGDTLNAKGDQFGTNCDYLAFIPLDPRDPTDGLLWVNHESLLPLFVSGWDGSTKRTKEQVIKEQKSVGGSIVRIRLNGEQKWELVANDPYNRRIDARTPIPLVAPRHIAGSKVAVGTMANCAGGITPWKTILTCEENYDDFYGEVSFDEKGRRKKTGESFFKWDEIYNYPPEHYGWVVEVDPFKGKAKKLTALGRMAHECATVVQLPDNRVVVYTGDDAENECLYKFISKKPNSLETGELFVADTVNGKWISLDIKKQPELRKKFKDQTEVLIRCREAAHMMGGTLLDRPEDIEIDPSTGHVLVTLTNNKPKGNFFGQIMKIVEKDNNFESMEFTASTFLAGGEKSGFACPDNLAFDRNGNLWMTSDISGKDMNKDKYKKFKNNGLFFIPMSGPNAGEVFQVASAPTDAEFTGPFFSPDGRTLFLSIQHPGERSKSLTELTSTWPLGGKEIPRSSVIAISI